MCLMATANHLVIIFLGVEMASVPSYALAGMLKGRRQSSEAALKYSVYGAGAAGVMLYGISLLAGVLGSCHLPTMAARMSELFAAHNASADQAIVMALGGLMLGVGLAFKFSAFPFHFWCPDVFEGASAEVDAFLSVASKAAALALLVRVVVGFTTLPTPHPGNVPLLPGGAAAVEQHGMSMPRTHRELSLPAPLSLAKQCCRRISTKSNADRLIRNPIPHSRKDPLSPATALSSCCFP